MKSVKAIVIVCSQVDTFFRHCYYCIRPDGPRERVREARLVGVAGTAWSSVVTTRERDNSRQSYSLNTVRVGPGSRLAQHFVTQSLPTIQGCPTVSVGAVNYITCRKNKRSLRLETTNVSPVTPVCLLGVLGTPLDQSLNRVTADVCILLGHRHGAFLLRSARTNIILYPAVSSFRYHNGTFIE